MIVGRSARMNRTRLEQRAYLMQRSHMVAVVLTVDGDVARRRRVEAEDQPHRRRLPGSVRAEKARHDARTYCKRDAVHGALFTVVLGQCFSLDHVIEGTRACVPAPRPQERTLILQREDLNTSRGVSQTS